MLSPAVYYSRKRSEGFMPSNGILLSLIMCILVILLASCSSDVPIQEPVQPVIPSVGHWHQAGEDVTLTLTGIKLPDCIQSWNSGNEIAVRFKILDVLGKSSIIMEGNVRPSMDDVATITIPAANFVPSEYRVSYYIETPICTTEQQDSVTNSVSLMSGLSQPVYWVEGDLDFQTSEPYREECCTALQITFRVLGVIVAIIVGLVIWLGMLNQENGTAGLIVGLIAVAIIWVLTFAWVDGLPGPLRYRELSHSKGFEGREIIYPNALIETIQLKPGLDIKKHMKAVNASLRGYLLAGESNFNIKSSLVIKIDTPKTELIHGEPVDITAYVKNDTDEEISVSLSLRCDDGTEYQLTQLTGKGHLEPVTFKDIILPEGEIICAIHEKTAKFNVLPKPSLEFAKALYKSDIGHPVKISGHTNFEDGQQIIMTVSKPFQNQKSNEITRQIVKADSGAFKFSVETDNFLEGQYEIAVSSVDETVKNTVDLQLTKRFILLKVEGISLPDRPIAIGDTISGSVTVRNLGNKTWIGDLIVRLGGHHVSNIQGEITSQVVKELPFTFTPNLRGEQILEIEEFKKTIMISGVPWIRIEPPKPVNVNQPLQIEFATNLNEGQILTELTRDGISRGSLITTLNNDNNCCSLSFPSDLLKEPGTYVINSFSSLYLESNRVGDQVSVEVMELGNKQLVYQIFPEPSDYVQEGREISVRLFIRNPGDKITQTLKMKVNEDFTEIPIPLEGGNKVTERVIDIGYLPLGYNRVEIDGRVRNIHVVPAVASNEVGQVITTELVASLHSPQTTYRHGDSTIVNITLTNRTKKEIEVTSIVTIPPGMHMSGGTCTAVQCSVNVKLTAGQTGGDFFNVQVSETATIQALISYTIGDKLYNLDLIRLTLNTS